MPRFDRQSYTLSTHTRAQVGFYTDQDNGLSVDPPVEYHSDFGHLVGVETDKQFGGASGTWSLTFKKNQRLMGARSALRDLWRDPEDVWVRIKFSVDGQIIDTVLGLIDSINESTSRTGGGTRSETYTISGRDFGKVFETTELFVNWMHANGAAPVQRATAIMDMLYERIEGTPAHFVKVLLETWVGNNKGAEAQWGMPAGLGGGFFFSHLSDNGIEPMSAGVNGTALAPQLFNPDQGGAKLWDSMQEYSNPMLNELYVDLANRGAQRIRQQGSNGVGVAGDLQNLTPTVFLRERPFPTRSDDGRTLHRKWDALRTHLLVPDDVAARNIAKGGSAHRFNYWYLQANGMLSESFDQAALLNRGVDGVEAGFPGNIPIWNKDSINRHGLRRYLAKTRFLPVYVSAAQENFFRLGARWLKKVHDWYSVAPFELSGTIHTSRVMPEIRIGHRVLEKRSEGNITYYVEGVKNSYQYPAAGSTTLTLTRGEYEDDDLLAFIYAQHASPRALTSSESCFIREGGEFGLGVDPVEFEANGIYDEECSVILPTVVRPIVGTMDSGVARGTVGEGEFTATDEQGRELEAERDGRVRPEGDPDSSFDRQLNETEPSVGNEQEIPTADEAQNTQNRPDDQSALDQDALERGEPIDTDLDQETLGQLDRLGFTTDPVDPL